MENLTAQFDTIDLDQLDEIFGTKSQTPTADDLIVGKDIDNQFRAAAQNKDNLPFIDLDNLEGFEDTTLIDTKDETKNEGTEEKTDEPNNDDKSVDEGSDDTEVTDDEDVTDEKQINSVLKNTVDYLVTKGLWKDFEGRDGLEIDADTYAELAAKQYEETVQERFNELLDTTGDYGKAIISYIKKGGNPDEIIDIFKEQKQVESIDISEVDGQTAIVEKYYSEILGWSKTRIDKHINRLRSEEGEFEEEATDIQDKFNALHKNQIQEIQRKEEEAATQRQEKQRQYVESIKTTVDTYEGFTEKERKLVKDSVLKFNKKLSDGTEVNDFYLKFYEIQNDPKRYVELIHFVMDKEGYDKKKEVKADAKAVDKSWNFIKGNSAVNKKGSQLPTQEKQKISKIDFSGVLKK